MSTGIITTADLALVLPTILSPARDVVEKDTFMRSRISTVSIKDGDGNSYNWPKFGTGLTAQSLTEGVAINNPQRLIPTSQTFTASEVGLEVMLTDKSVRQTPEAMRARAGRYMGNAMKRRMEQDILALFAGASRDLGAAGAAFDPNVISAGMVRLLAASGTGADAASTESASGAGPISAVIHNFHMHDILKSSATFGTVASPQRIADGWSQQMMRSGNVGDVYGVDIAQNALIAIDGSDDAVGALFAKEALVFVKTSVMMRTEVDRVPALRSTALYTTSEYGTGEVEDQWFFKITADATPPTA